MTGADVERIHLVSDILRYPRKVTCRIDGVGQVPLDSFNIDAWTFRVRSMRCGRTHGTVTIWFKGKRLALEPGLKVALTFDVGVQHAATFTVTKDLGFHTTNVT